MNKAEDTPTFYQTLAGVTHLDEAEIVELEKQFWKLAGNSNSGQITQETIGGLVSPPLPAVLLPAFFAAFDENQGRRRAGRPSAGIEIDSFELSLEEYR